MEIQKTGKDIQQTGAPGKENQNKATNRMLRTIMQFKKTFLKRIQLECWKSTPYIWKYWPRLANNKTYNIIKSKNKIYKKLDYQAFWQQYFMPEQNEV